MAQVKSADVFNLLARLFNVRRQEMKSFGLAAFSLFFISASNVLFSNFAETAFLKRFGVHYLPTLILINALVTFAVMTFVGRLMTRMPGQTVLRRTLVFCALTAALARLAVPLDLSLLYPVVYVMKTQYELLLTFLFWNLANQTFSTRQSKRMFPLIVSGGIVGGISGSFATPWVARLGSVDNILWAYLAGTLVAALLVGLLARSATEKSAEPGSQKVRPKSSMLEDLRQALPVMRASRLVRWLVLLTLIPNMVVPLLNYQVSFAIDMTYADEASMIHFYSMYRGAQFILALLVSLFAGRIYSRFGLGGGLLVHPFNYLLIFVAFMLQFDLLTAVYAGISAGVLRRAIQTPARAALIGLFPDAQRVMLMPFLRGVVVRMGALVGAIFVLVCQSGYFVVCRFPLHPQNLAPFGFAFAAIWLVFALRMKRHYPELVLETLDWHGSERGRMTFGDRLVAGARTKLSSAGQALAQATAVRQQATGPLADSLVEHLSATAENLSVAVLRELEAEDTSGRLLAVRLAVEGEDPRRRANAIEALEQLVPHSLSHNLVKGLERCLQRGWKYPGPVLETLAGGADPVAKELAQRLLADSGNDDEPSKRLPPADLP